MKSRLPARARRSHWIVYGAVCLYVLLLRLLYGAFNPIGFVLTNLFFALALVIIFFRALRGRKQLNPPAPALISCDLAVASVAASLSLTREWMMIGSSPLAVALAMASIFVFWPLLWGLKCALFRFGDRISPQPEFDEDEAARGRRGGCVVFFTTLAILLVMWTLFFPYSPSNDTRYLWAQIHGEFPYNDVHAVGFTMLLRLLLRIVDSYAFVILLQILAVSLLYAMFAACFARRGVPIPLLVALFGLFACSQPVTYTIYGPWKDTAYSCCVGAVTLLMMRWIEDPAAFAGKKCWRGAALGLAMAGVYLMRQNGIVILLFVGGYFLFAMLRRRMLLPLAATVSVALATILAVNGYAYGILGVEPAAKNGFPYQVFGSGIAAIVNDESVTDEELERIDEVLPVEWMQEHYHPWTHQLLIWDHDEEYTNPDDPADVVYNSHFVVELGLHGWEAIRLYLELLPRHLAACARDILENTVSIWGHPFRCVMAFDNISLLIVLFLALARRPRRRGWLPVCAPTLLNIVSIAISSITNATRYLLPTSLLFPALLLFVLMPEGGSRPAEPGKSG